MLRVFERAIAAISPAWALARAEARASLSQVETLLGTQDGYKAGKNGRLNKRAVMMRENDVPRENLLTVRARSWQAFRDDPYVRKGVRAISAKVIGAEMTLSSQAVAADGSPLTDYRRAVTELWKGLHTGFDYRGMPGQGGTTLAGLQRLALQQCILSGGVLYRLRVIDPAEQARRELPVPLVLQLVDISRLADSTTDGVQVAEGNVFYRGIELTPDGQRVRYWLKDYDSEGIFRRVVPVSASEMNHLFWEDDVEQMQGTGWLAASLDPASSVSNLTSTVLTSLEMQACVALGVKRGAGKRRIGVNPQGTTAATADSDLRDVNGNTLTEMRPGMIMDLGLDGEMQAFSPNSTSANPEAFANHVLRGVAAGLPAVKSSTLIGDYRNSSFSSEKSADNDIWPEVEQLQDWFASAFMQPIFSTVVRFGILTGALAGTVTPDEFVASPKRYLSAKWQGPVAQSINPEKDEQAAAARMKNGKSTPQMECARSNVDYDKVLAGWKQFMEDLERLGLPKEAALTMLGVTMPSQPAGTAAVDEDTSAADDAAAGKSTAAAGAAA